MSEPPHRISDDWAVLVRDSYMVCMTAERDERAKDLNHPAQWDPNAPEPPKAITGNGHVDLSSMKDWQLRNAPKDPGVVTADKWNEGTLFWGPSRARLTDAEVIFALLTLTPNERKKLFVWDFTSSGDPRHGRVPKRPTSLS
ncbi:hypothetical protein N7452_007459 [Penicillium brevicompactum]|uniref:Uncharacterized protein n=1 Tax=Penicillium brevicompactum TaxID=5074 RepID=A0A9W9QHS6_PENBR|nr:hypothetical protein N7452_007459 [Penicillium brevicompactum]